MGTFNVQGKSVLNRHFEYILLFIIGVYKLCK